MQQGIQQQVAADEAEPSAKAARWRKTVAQQRREAEVQQATPSVREVYRKLASALHPDRETDEQQRVNEADDLLALLELQIEFREVP